VTPGGPRGRPAVPRAPSAPAILGATSLVLLAVALAFHFAPLPWPANRFDAGIHVVAAQRLLRGDVPYVDFQTLYTPGRYHLVAGAFVVFGATYDVASYVDFALMAVQAWVAWHVAARLTESRFVALVAFAAGLAFSYPYPSLTLALVALLVAARATRDLRVAPVVIGGAVAGLAGWFRQDVGAAAAVAVAATIWTGTAAGPVRRLARAATAGLASAGVLALLLVSALVHAPDRLWEGLVTNPAATVPFRTSPDGVAAVFREEWFFGVVAVLALVGGVVGIARAVVRPAPLVVGASVLALWSLRYLCLRPETHHLVPAALLVCVLWPAVLPPGSALRLPAFVLCAAVVVVPLRRAAGARVAHALGLRATSVATLGPTLPGATTLHLPADEVPDYRRLVETIRALVPAGHPFLSACRRHDQIHDQDLLLHFVADRPAIPFDWHFDPGVTTRADVQRRIVADCERADVRVVVRYDAALHGVAGPDQHGALVLDEWIAARFTPRETIGRYEIWAR
jgi:hypothetical protein